MLLIGRCGAVSAGTQWALPGTLEAGWCRGSTFVKAGRLREPSCGQTDDVDPHRGRAGLVVDQAPAVEKVPDAPERLDVSDEAAPAVEERQPATRALAVLLDQEVAVLDVQRLGLVLGGVVEELDVGVALDHVDGVAAEPVGVYGHAYIRVGTGCLGSRRLRTRHAHERHGRGRVGRIIGLAHLAVRQVLTDLQACLDLLVDHADVPPNHALGHLLSEVWVNLLLRLQRSRQFARAPSRCSVPRSTGSHALGVMRGGCKVREVHTAVSLGHMCVAVQSRAHVEQMDLVGADSLAHLTLPVQELRWSKTALHELLLVSLMILHALLSLIVHNVHPFIVPL